MFMSCALCHAQISDTEQNLPNVTLSNGTEVRTSYDPNQGVLQIQVENNSGYLEGFSGGRV